ncbi:MAG: hypothetical protein VX246_07810 [Myxococcota bacterium]|nr:hypothetical protein [Myxococcota bacterium]
MSTPHQARREAADAVWNWRSPSADATAASESSPARLRMIGSLQGLVTGSVATALYLFWSPTVGTIVFCISAIILFSALVSPTGLYRGVQALFSALGNATGRALTWLMLVPLFYLFFVPFGLMLRRGRRDLLQRYFEADKASYWEAHKEFSAEDHERQF